MLRQIRLHYQSSHTHTRFGPAAMNRTSDEQPPRMSDEEKRLARKWWCEGKTQTEIGILLSRHKSSISRAVDPSAVKKAQGRPHALSSDAVDKVMTLSFRPSRGFRTAFRPQPAGSAGGWIPDFGPAALGCSVLNKALL